MANVCVYRLPQKRVASSGGGSRLPMSSKHVTSGPSSRSDTTTNNNNNNQDNNGPTAGDSPGVKVSRDCNDVTAARPCILYHAAAGKRSSSSRKAAVSGGRATARPAAAAIPGHGETVVLDSTGAAQSSRHGGKLSISATSSPAASGASTSSPRKQQMRSSASLTDVAAARTVEPELQPPTPRRKAMIPGASRPGVVPRGRPPPPRTARPASDGGVADPGTARGALGCSRLPSAVTGSVKTISEAKTAVMTSFKPNQHQQQQQSLKSGHRFVSLTSSPSSSSSSALRFTEDPTVQLAGSGHDTQPVVACANPPMSGSSLATREIADDTEGLSVDLQRVPDNPTACQSSPERAGECADVSEWQKNGEEQQLKSQNNRQNSLTATGTLTVNETVLDEQGYYLNLAVVDQQTVPDGREISHASTDNQVVSQNLPTEQGNYQSFMEELEERTEPCNVTADQKHQRCSVDTKPDAKTVPVGQSSSADLCYQLTSDKHKAYLLASEDAYQVIDRKASCDNDVITDMTSFSDVIHPPSKKPESSVVMTTAGATESINTATVTGEY